MSEKSKGLHKNESAGSAFLMYFGKFVLIVVLLYTLDVMILRNGSFNIAWAFSSAFIITCLSQLIAVAKNNHK